MKLRALLLLAAGLLFAAPTPTPVPPPQKRVEGIAPIRVVNDGGSYAVSLMADAGLPITSLRLDTLSVDTITRLDGGHPSLTLTDPTYATQAAVNLYVDPTGSDSNACTSSGSSACLTLQGAESRIPKLARHPVVVSVAAGHYTGLGIYGHSFDPASVTNGAYISWVGALTNATVATGTATGTATGGTAGSASAFGTIIDSGQSWTSNNLKGFILEKTGGTGVGEKRIITSNTSTTITAAGNWTAPAAGSTTYAIRDWATIVDTAILQPALPGLAAATPVDLRMEGNGSVRYGVPSALGTLSGQAAINFTDIAFAPTTSQGVGARLNGPNQVAFRECKIAGNGAGQGVSVLYESQVGFDRSWVTSGTSTAIGSAFSNGVGSYLETAGCLIESASASSGVVLNIGTQGAHNFDQISQNNSAGGAVVATSFGFSGNVSIGKSFINCTAGGTTKGVDIADISSQSIVNLVFNQANTITNCDTAIRVAGRGSFSNNIAGTITGSGAQTAAIEVKRGGMVQLLSDFTVSGYTTEIKIDTTTSTYAAFLALSPQLISSVYGSVIFK